MPDNTYVCACVRACVCLMQANNAAGVLPCGVVSGGTVRDRTKRSPRTVSIVVVNKLTKFPKKSVIERISWDWGYAKGKRDASITSSFNTNLTNSWPKLTRNAGFQLATDFY